MSRDVKIIVYSFLIYLATGLTFLVTDKDFLVFLPIMPIIILLVTFYFFVISIQKELIPALLTLSNSLGIIGLLFLNIFEPSYKYLVVLSLISISLSGIFLSTIIKNFTSSLLGILFSSTWLYIFDDLFLDFLAWGILFFSSFAFYKLYKSKLRSSQIRLILQVGLIGGVLFLTLLSDFIIRNT